MQKNVSVANTEKQVNPVLFFALFIAVLAVIAVIINIATGGVFLESKNVRLIITASIYPAFIAWGLCFLQACGYTDLSIGGVVVLSSFAAVAFGNAYGYVGLILGGVITGTILVFLNFSIFAFAKIPSWIASISLAMVYEAAALALRASRTTRPIVDVEIDKSITAIGKYPVNLILLLVGFAVVYILYNQTSIGQNIRAVGGNKTVAKSLGVNVTKTLLAVGLICGILIGIASVLQEIYVAKTNPMSGLTSMQLVFKPLAIAMLAQIVQKWINIIIAVPFCSLIIYGVFNAMAFFGIPSGTLQDVLLCAFLLVFGAVGQRGAKEVVK